MKMTLKLLQSSERISMSYSISEVAKLLNISVETVRFYEEKGIIAPKRKTNSKYRRYESWDIFRLYECLQYRALHFTLEEADRTMNSASIQEFSDMIEEKEQALRKKVHFDTMLLSRMTEMRERSQLAAANIGHFWVTKAPRTHYIFSTVGSGDAYEAITPSKELGGTWLSYAAFMDFCVQIRLQDVLEKNDREYWCGAMDDRYIRYFSVPLTKKVRTKEPALCLTTNVDMGDHGNLSIEWVCSLLEKAEEENLEVCGDVWGKLLHRYHENGKYHRIMELSVPISV